MSGDFLPLVAGPALFVLVTLHFHGHHRPTILELFQRIGLILHIAMSVLPGTSLLHS